MQNPSTPPTSSATRLLTPRDLADAIGASESALRRWVDAGRIRMSRTVGGHRRIPLQEAIRFIRQTGATVVRPELLGLNDVAAGDAARSGSDEALLAALRDGDRAVARGLIVSSYLQGQGLPAIFDGPLRAAMEGIGQMWNHDPRGIMIEHRATAICIDIVAELRGLLPLVDEHAPLAVGGAPSNDPYQLPTMMAAAVLAEAGFRDTNFGPNTPLELLAQEALDRKARMAWLSVSAEQDPKLIRSSIRKLADVLGRHKIMLVVGGRFAAASSPRGGTDARLVTGMADLSTVARDAQLRPR